MIELRSEPKKLPIKFETLEEVLKAYPYAGQTTKEMSETFNPEGMWHRVPKSVKHPWKTKWKSIWKKLKVFKWIG